MYNCKAINEHASNNHDAKVSDEGTLSVLALADLAYAQAGNVIQNLAEKIEDDTLRTGFLTASQMWYILEQSNTMRSSPLTVVLTPLLTHYQYHDEESKHSSFLLIFRKKTYDNVLM